MTCWPSPLPVAPANEVYWQGRIERDQSGRETALTVYREVKLDRLAKANPSITTVQRRHPPLLRDPAALVGRGHVRHQIGIDMGVDWREAEPAVLAIDPVL